MKALVRSFLVFALILASLACSLPFLGGGDQVEFTALETSAQATSIARLTQEVLSGAAATAIVQSLNATNQALASSPPTLIVAPSVTVAPPPGDAGGVATAAAQATAFAQAIRITSEAQIGQATQSALVATLTALGPAQPPVQPPPPVQVPVLGTFRFAPGATSAETGGQLPGGAVVDYLVPAQAGQTMLASIYSPNNNVYLGVSGVSDGAVFQRAAAGQTGFTGALSITQNYRLTLAAPPQGSQFTLQVIIPARIQLAPGGVSASIPGQLGARQTNFYLANAQGGQTMTVRILSPNNDIFLTIYGMTDGSPLVRSVMAQTSWTGGLPITQDYMIQAVSTDQAASYTLEVTIR